MSTLVDPPRHVPDSLASIAVPTADAEAIVDAARDLGFSRFLYTVESFHFGGPPLHVVGRGWSSSYLKSWLAHAGDDPIRQMIARGEIELTTLPLFYENLGSSLSVDRRRKPSANEVTVMRSALAEGVRSALSLAIRMPRARYATINFYSNSSEARTANPYLVDRLFLLGHQVHAALEPRCRSIRSGPRSLSTRELECLKWLSHGKTNGEIANILGLSGETVKDHMRSLFRKLGVTTRAEAVARGFTLSYLAEG